MKNIAVVGFGLCGRLAALMLSRHHRLTIFEQQAADAPRSAGCVAAAMLAPLAESVLCDRDLAEMGCRSLAIWPQLLDELNEPVFFQRNGSLVVAHPNDRGDLESFCRRLKPLDGFVAEAIDAIRLGDLEPQLTGRFSSGIYLPGEGQLDNHAFYRASYRTLQERGAVFHCGKTVLTNANRVNNMTFDCVIDCRGAAARGEISALRAVRGEVARIKANEVALRRPVRLMHPRYSIYIVPKPDNEFVIGASEIESCDDGPVTVRSTLELLSAAYSVHSGFAEARVLSLQSASRPAFTDNRPRVEYEPGVIRINGLYRHGYLLGPAVIEDALTQLL